MAVIFSIIVRPSDSDTFLISSPYHERVADLESSVHFLLSSQRPLIRSFIRTTIHSTNNRYSTRLRFKVSWNVLPISLGPHDMLDTPISCSYFHPFSSFMPSPIIKRYSTTLLATSSNTHHSYYPSWSVNLSLCPHFSLGTKLFFSLKKKVFL